MADPDDDGHPQTPQVGEIDMPEGVQNAGSRESVKSLAKRQKLRQQGIDEMVRRILAEEYGRAFLFDLLSLGGMFAPAGNAAFDSNALWFREGARQVALHINAVAWRANPAAYKTMLEENTTSP